uniref:Uncharacterized protein AlNc14C171G8014 n=1 Tax=Albugo laibachii Nc14 TaxID=890382 RepID=F0WEJ9_9STRA|nr:conserved hypothetical protein [Albugo laibachii Nc14]CCA22881.1 conserved hypothetical protein [Albugo laibachii Nc14]|eukprot:CCA22881.1 conserved hypothetical protein [Albugo laibachii Nc14]
MTSIAPRRTGGLILYTLIFSWGKAHFGCLGREENASSTSPREVTFFRGLNPSQIATGMDHSMVLCLAGKHSFLYTFGGNQFGQLGLGVTWQYSVVPQLVDRLSQVPIVSISAGSSYSVAVSAKGELYSWGDGMYGKNCTGGGGISCVPKKIDSFRNLFVTQVSAGKSNGVGLLRNSTKKSRFVTRDFLTLHSYLPKSK